MSKESKELEVKNDINQKFNINYNEYEITKNNIVYKIFIFKKDNIIIMICDKYILFLNLKDLKSLTKKYFNNINEGYKFINDIFKNNEMTIIEHKKKKRIIQLSSIKNSLLITLKYNINLTDTIISKIKNNKKELLFDFIPLNQMKINIDLYIPDIFIDEYIFYKNIMQIFKSVNNLLYLVYLDYNGYIICYDLNNNQIVSEINNNQLINNINHCLDYENKRDLIISSGKTGLQLWDLKNIECLIQIKNINITYSCFMNENNNIYILYSYLSSDKKEYKINIIDLNANIIKELNCSDDKIYFIDTYYDENINKNYIITGNFGCIVSYDYINNKTYHSYTAPKNFHQNIFVDKNNFYLYVIIKKINEIIQLIGLNKKGTIKIWNFHTEELIREIKITKDIFEVEKINSMYLWDNDYLFIGWENLLIIMQLSNFNIIKKINYKYDKILNINKIIHRQYGEILMIQAFEKKNKDSIKTFLDFKLY